MRRTLAKLIFAAGATLLCAAPALAEKIAPETHKIATETNLRAKPGAKARTLAVLAPGVEVAVEGVRGEWALVTLGELRGYVAGSAIAPYNPHCDLGYPYSGSSPYFTGLTELRTSVLFGALFGYHPQRPC